MEMKWDYTISPRGPVTPAAETVSKMLFVKILQLQCVKEKEKISTYITLQYSAVLYRLWSHIDVHKFYYYYAV